MSCCRSRQADARRPRAALPRADCGNGAVVGAMTDQSVRSVAAAQSSYPGKVAIEEHVAPQELWPLITNPGWPQDAWQRVLNDLADTDRRLKLMDAGGISTAALSLGSNGIQELLDPGEAAERAISANDALASMVAAHPDRFVGFAALPMQDPELAAKELCRAVTDLGFRGALVNGYTSVGDPDAAAYYDHASFEPFWSTLEALDVPLYLHPRNPLPSQRRIYEGREELLGPTWAFAMETGTHALRLITSGLFDRHPRATVILGHLGEFLPFAIHRLEQRMSRIPEIQLNRSPIEVLAENFYVTTSGNYHTPSFRACLEQLGSERLIFACDYPFEVMQDGTSWFDALSIDGASKWKVAASNAAALLGLEVATSAPMAGDLGQ